MQRETGVILESFEELTPNARKIAYKKYSIIAPVIAVIGDKSLRNSMITFVSTQFNISKQTVRSYVCLYLSYQNLSVFAPAPTKKRELTADEKNYRWALNRYYYTRNQNSLKVAYSLMLKSRYCDNSGKLFDKYPSFNQFRYYFRKTRVEEKYLISRKGLKVYQKDYRPLIGDGVQAFAPNVGTAMLDGTVCDIYLIDECGNLIGRPVLAVAIDANSSLCLGFTLGWEGTTYSLVKLMLSIIEDKDCEYS